MRVSGFLSGGSPIVKRYQIGAAITKAGIPITGSASATTTGVIAATTTNIVGMVGVNVDTPTYSTTQQGTGGGGGGSMGAPGGSGGGVTASAAAYMGIIINPDVLITARLSGGATVGTALTSYAITTAQSAGLTVSSTNLGTNSMAAGTGWFLTGANAGASRRISGTWTNSASFVVVVPYDYAIAVGDTVAVCPYSEFGNVNEMNTGQLTTDFTEFDASIAVAGTGLDGICVVELFLRDAANNGVNDSWITWSPAANHQLYSSAAT